MSTKRKQVGAIALACASCSAMIDIIMVFRSEIDVRPRTTGEIMDDAWRLCLSDIPALWLLAGLFHIPLAVLVLLLVTGRPESVLMKFLVPIGAALAVLWTGIGVGACQELFRRRPGGGNLVI